MLINPPGKKKSEFDLTPSGPLAPAGGDSDGQTLNVTKTRSCSEGCLELEKTCPEAYKIPVKQKKQSWKWKLRIRLFWALCMLDFAYMIHSLVAAGLEQKEPRLPSLRVVPEPQGYSWQLTSFLLLSAPCQNNSKGEAAVGHLSCWLPWGKNNSLNHPILSLIPGDWITPDSQLPCNGPDSHWGQQHNHLPVALKQMQAAGGDIQTKCCQWHMERQTGTFRGLAKIISKHTCSFMLYMQACTLVKANKGTLVSDYPENSEPPLMRTVCFKVLVTQCDTGQSFTSQEFSIQHAELPTFLG